MNNEKRFYVHEVLTEKGTTPFNRGPSKTSDLSGGDAPSINSVLRRILEVKNSRSAELIMPKLTRHDEGQNSIGPSFTDLGQNQRENSRQGREVVNIRPINNSGCN